ncbi:MAG: FliM/FliN family flagellar motor switch protein [Planctomycetota bacterium]|nr:FliM/FliN family flagellar motor switch protein [Planctomycetota bacterium]
MERPRRPKEPAAAGILHLARSDQRRGPDLTDKGTMPDDLNRILRLEVPLIVQIAERKMMLSEVTSLTHGSIIELPKAIDEPLDVLINNAMIGHGHAVKVSENFGIHITQVSNLHARVKALGAKAEVPPAEPVAEPAAATA